MQSSFSICFLNSYQMIFHLLLAFFNVITWRWFGRFVYKNYHKAFISPTKTHFQIISKICFDFQEYCIIVLHLFIKFAKNKPKSFNYLIIIQKQTSGIFFIEFIPYFIHHHCLGNMINHTHICNTRRPPSISWTSIVHLSMRTAQNTMGTRGTPEWHLILVAPMLTRPKWL